MNYIVMDLEWNQGNAYKEAEVYNLPFEIIEIGAVKLNQDRKMIGEFSELIKPQVYHEMHHITRKLIHLQMEELEKGKPFVEVCNWFLDWCGENTIFCTWGPLDLSELQRNMDYYQMDSLANGPLKYLDVQKLFSFAYEDKKMRRSLEYAIDFLKIEKDIPFHRAFSDAYYTAKVLAHIQDKNVLTHCSYDVYHTPKNKDDEVHVIFDTYAKYISREFDDKTQALEDKDVISCRCYICNKNCKKKIKWFSSNGKHYYAVSLCEKHGLMKGKIRIRKSEDDKVYVVKTEKFISKEESEEIKLRQTKSKEQKKKKDVEKKANISGTKMKLFKS